MSLTMSQPTSLTTTNPVIVEGQGPIPCPFMVIGEAPGRTEIERGEPFIGKSGQLLRDTLAEFGSQECYITNCYKGDVGEGNRNPTREELDDHWPLLMEELGRVDPAGVLLVGAVAIRRFLGNNTDLVSVVGERIAHEGRQFYPVWHPAYILRQPSRLENFRYAVARFVLTTEVLSKYERGRVPH